MDWKSFDVNVLRNLYPNPKASEPKATCGYCVGGTLMAYMDGLTAAMLEEGLKTNERLSYFPRVPELAEVLRRANPELTPAMAERYADFITRLNDRKRFNLAWSYLKEALECNEQQPSYEPLLPLLRLTFFSAKPLLFLAAFSVSNPDGCGLVAGGHWIILRL